MTLVAAASLLNSTDAYAVHDCFYETGWGPRLTISGEFPEENLNLKYGDVEETCNFFEYRRRPHLREVSGWLPLAYAKCGADLVPVTFVDLERGGLGRPIMVFDGNVYYRTCPGHPRTDLG